MVLVAQKLASLPNVSLGKKAYECAPLNYDPQKQNHGV